MFIVELKVKEETAFMIDPWTKIRVHTQCFVFTCEIIFSHQMGMHENPEVKRIPLTP